MARTASSPDSILSQQKTKTILVAVFVFLLPWFFLPVAFEAYETAKVYLSAFLVGALALMCARQFWQDKKLTLQRTPFDRAILLFVAVYLFATLFSIHTATSAWGYYSRLSEGLVGLLIFTALYYVVTHNLKSIRDVLTVVRSWVLSVSVLAVFIILQYFGLLTWLWEGLNRAGGIISYSGRFTPVGSSSSLLGVFLVALPLAVALLYFGKRSKNDPFKVLVVIGAVLITLAAAITAARMGLSFVPVLTIGVLFGLLLLRFRSKIGNNVFHVAVVIVFALIFTFIFLLPGVHERLGLPSIPVEMHAGIRASWDVASRSITGNGAKGLLLGSGPDTFFYDYTASLPVEYNNTVNWHQRYANAGSEILDILQGTGVLGLAALLFLVYVVIRVAGRELALFERKTATGTTVLVPVVSSILVSLVLMFVSPFTAINWIMLFMLLALLTVSIYDRDDKQKKAAQVVLTSQSGTSKLDGNSILPRIAAALIAVLLLTGTYILGRQFAADLMLRNSLTSLQLNDIQTAYTEAQNAVSLAPDKPYIQRNLALISTRFAQILASSQPQTQEELERNMSFVDSLVRQAVFGIQTAVVQNRADVESHESAANIYASMFTLSEGKLYKAETLAALRNSIAVDPYNPDHFINLGLFLYRNEQVEEAEVSFRNAHRLRPDYANSVLALGSLLEEKDNLEEARVFYEQVLALDSVGDETALGMEVRRRLETLGENTLFVNEEPLEVEGENSEAEDNTQSTDQAQPAE
ncbi:MAG: Tetratricopeptide repeat protein [candidate division WS6 bacterium OLB20]|uniref:Tetratricopeptide repeat protein n=1 Tax=candidate division WS6 bacterium OLB20 TaxID=1617426 RepID=A0A136LZB2_9BACT|nr:MAG: Tetratricopeptide repeat protein [candidate division WS6 bacterium OLB20]